MQKVCEKIRREKVIAIIRGFSPEICLHLAEAYWAGGIRFVEVTFDQCHPELQANTLQAIAAIHRRFGMDLLVGAGTVLNRVQLQRAVDAGAAYVISPHVDTDLIHAALQSGLVAVPGAMTPTEAVLAYSAGAQFVKIFPAGTLGPGYVKAITAPLSQIPFLAVGGISAENAASFIKAGCVGVGVGGTLTNRDWIAAGKWDEITRVARALKESVA